MSASGLVLGLNVSHDRSAAIALDGKVVAAIAEERLDRVKHSIAVAPDGSYLCTLPLKAMEYVLRQVGAKITDCSAIVAVGSVIYHPLRPLRNLSVEDVSRQLPPEVEASRIQVMNHHLAHAVGAFAASPFEEAAVLVADGAGNVIADRRSPLTIPQVEHTTFYHAQGSSMRELRKITSRARSMNSLGAMYQLVTMFSGFGQFQEGKTMGLAPYGAPDLAVEWEQAVKHDGLLSYNIPPIFQTFDLRGRMIPAKFVRRYGPPRHHSEALRAVDRNLAFAAQRTLEKILVDLARDLKQATGCRNLVLAGGVALNSVANQKIAERSGFERVFIIPCAADDGTALGAALWPHFHSGVLKNWVMNHAFLGRAYSEAEYLCALMERENLIRWSKPQKLPEQAAARLADGAIMGWHEGGSEIGPRALGHRSIACDPRRVENKYLINARVKYRESFRPFAPAVPVERAADYFDLDGPSPFMLRVARVKRPQEIPAVTHVDGTGRVQTVTAAENDLFYQLIIEFDRLTGVPVLLNTSLNLAGDPIAETPADALDCFLKSQMDCLVLGPFLAEKKYPALSNELAQKHHQLIEFRNKNAALEAELEAIRQSRGWRLLQQVNRLRIK